MSEALRIECRLTRRQVTLIRVACITRLNDLKARGMEDSDSYRDTKSLLNVELWFAATGIREIEDHASANIRRDGVSD